MIMKLVRFVGFLPSAASFLLAGGNVFAQIATEEAKGGTSGALPNAGTTELTYLLFIGGVILFVFGTLKLVLSYRE